MSLEIHSVAVNVGAISNENRPIFKVPSDNQGGGITVLSAFAVLDGAGTTSLDLVNLGSSGTVLGGTIAAKGSAVYTAAAPESFTVQSANEFVDAGEWVGVRENNVGAGDAVTIVGFNYQMGK